MELLRKTSSGIPLSKELRSGALSKELLQKSSAELRGGSSEDLFQKSSCDRPPRSSAEALQKSSSAEVFRKGLRGPPRRPFRSALPGELFRGASAELRGPPRTSAELFRKGSFKRALPGGLRGAPRRPSERALSKVLLQKASAEAVKQLEQLDLRNKLTD